MFENYKCCILKEPRFFWKTLQQWAYASIPFGQGRHCLHAKVVGTDIATSQLPFITHAQTFKNPGSHVLLILLAWPH